MAVKKAYEKPSLFLTTRLNKIVANGSASSHVP